MELNLWLYFIMAVTENALAVVMAGLMLFAALHATFTSERAFTAFARYPRVNWLVILWIGVAMTLLQGLAALNNLAQMLFSIHLPFLVWLPTALFSNFFGLLLFAVPGVYFALEYPRLQEFKRFENGRGPFQQRPTGPRDW